MPSCTSTLVRPVLAAEAACAVLAFSATRAASDFGFGVSGVAASAQPAATANVATVARRAKAAGRLRSGFVALTLRFISALFLSGRGFRGGDPPAPPAE